MRVAKRICAFALALTIAFLSVGYEPPKANASLLASVGWSCAVSAYLNGIGLTMDATCDAAEDIAYDVREWHENTIMPIWEKYEKAIDATFDYATLIANGVNMSVSKQVRFSPELCSIFSEFAAWLISEFSLIGEDGAPVTNAVYVVDPIYQALMADGSYIPVYLAGDSSTGYAPADESLLIMPDNAITEPGTYSFASGGKFEVFKYYYNDYLQGRFWRPGYTADWTSFVNYNGTIDLGGFLFGIYFSESSKKQYSCIFAYNADGSYHSTTTLAYDACTPQALYGSYSGGGVTILPAADYAGALDVPDGKELVVALPEDSDVTTWEDFCTDVAQQDLEGVYTPEAVTVEDAQAGTTDSEDTEEDTATLVGTTNGILDWTKKIWQSIKDIPKDIADMLTDAFVLSDEYAEALPQILTDTFAERTGFLTYPMSLLFGFVDLISTPAGDFILEWDDVYEPFSRGKLISAGQFNVTQYVNSNQALSNVYSLWKTVVSGYLIFMFFDLCYKKYNAIVRDRLG